MRLAAAFTLSLLFWLPSISAADDWPQWRGPNRDGVWSEDGVYEKFPSEKLKPRWRAEIAAGYSGPTMADGRVFVTDRITRPHQAERVHCFDFVTGEKLWTHEYECVYRNVSYQAGPRASVTIDDGRAYSIGTMGHLFCLDAASGRVLWSHDCDTEYKIDMPIWGIAGSPLVFDNLCVVQIGGEGACLVAFDKVSGEEVWRALDDRASYSSPILHEQAGQRVLICWTGDNVVALEPKTGKLHWKHPFTPRRMVLSVATPVIEDDRLFLTAFYDGALMLKLSDQQLAVEPIWRRAGSSERDTDALHSIIATPYMEGDYVYGVDSYGEFRCLEAESGDRVWESLKPTPKARWSNIHMVQNGPDTWMFNERGELIISRLSPDGYQEISRTKIIEPTREQLNQRGGVCWAFPAFAEKHVIARNDHEIVCTSLAK